LFCDQTFLTKDGRSLNDRVVGYRPIGAELKHREIQSPRHGWTLTNLLRGNGDFHCVVVRKDNWKEELGHQFKRISRDVSEVTNKGAFVNGELMAFIALSVFSLEKRKRLWLTDWATAHNSVYFRAAVSALNMELQIQPGGTTSISAVLDDKRCHGILKPFFKDKMRRVRIAEFKK